MTFDIREHVEFSDKNRAQCPACALVGKDSGKSNLSLIPGTDGAYKCHRGCTPQEIRNALGNPKSDRQIPRAIAVPDKAKKYTPQKLLAATEKLLNQSTKAKQWLNDRGITDEMIREYRLGIYEARDDRRRIWSIGVPIPATATTWYIKKRKEAWNPDYTGKAWGQTGIPASLFWGHKPDQVTECWITEGEWDAMVLGQLLKGTTIAVVSFTCGCKSLPGQDALDEIPGVPTKIFYDLDEPGRLGASRVAEALPQAKPYKVPAPTDAPEGWDTSNAIQHGFTIEDFQNAQELPPSNPTDGLWSNLISNDQLLDRAADYMDWLVPDLLTTDEMFLLAASPRAGKSLMALSLAHAVASGGKFLGRPCSKGAVVYVRLEDSEAKTKEREIAQGWERGLDVYWLDKFKLDQVADLEKVIEKLGASLLVIDTLSRARSSDISESAAEMSQVLDPLADLAKRQKCTVLLVHHTSKIQLNNANDLTTIFETIRGSSAIRATCRGTMILAASQDTYRLCYENGWGKGDLKVVLDANSLRWRVLEQWHGPEISLSQKDQVLDVLNRIQQGTIDQISEATQLPKRSLYEVLKRLQADDLIEKRGNRQGAVYVRKSIQQIQQLNSLLNRSNVERERDSASIQQNSLPCNFPAGRTIPANGRPAGRELATANEDLLNSEPESLPQEDFSNSTAIQQFNNSTNPKFPATPGTKCRYTPPGGNGEFSQIARRKILEILAIDGDLATCTAPGWVVSPTIPLAHLSTIEK